MKDSTRPSLSIFSVNLLYLAIILLTLTVGSLIQTANLLWGLIASEVLLYLLPAIALLRWRRIPLREGLRLRPISPRLGLLCLLLGFTTYLWTIVVDVVMAQITHIPDALISVDSLPKGALGALGYFFAFAILPALCEELLFRGAIQGAYEKQRSPHAAIIVVGLMFAFWHMRVSGLVALLPVALILGYVAWCTGSVYASILVHFALNGTASINTLLSLNRGSGLPYLGPAAAAVGLVATVVLIYFLRRSGSATRQPVMPEQGTRLSRLRDYSPLLASGLIYLGVAALTVTQLAGTGMISLQEAGYDEVRIPQALESRFRITTQAGAEAGQVVCTIQPQGANFRLDCKGDVGGYDVATGGSLLKEGNQTLTWSATWSGDTMDLLDFTFERTCQETAGNFGAVLKEGRLVVEDSTGAQELAVSPDVLLAYEWAWRTHALKPQVVSSIRAPFVYLSLEDEENGSGPALKEEVLHLYRSQRLDLPAGQVQARKSTLGGQAAWYTNDHAGPVRLDDGELIYELE